MHSAAFIFTPNTKIKTNELEELLSKKFRYELDVEKSLPLCFYDTFDLKLFAQGLMLAQGDNTLRLCQKSNLLPIHLIAWKSKMPVFAKQLPPGEIRNIVESIVEVRALMPLMEFHYVERRYNIVNKIGKITTVFTLLEFERKSDKQSLQVYRITKLRGYEKNFNNLIRYLNAEHIYRAEYPVGNTLLKMDGKIRYLERGLKYVSLGAQSNPTEALLAILRFQFDKIKLNEPGVLEGLDTEFLHDYRVAVRKIRSMFSQLKSALPKQFVKEFNPKFKEIGKNTNRMRDLDVYLLNHESFFSLIPNYLHKGLQNFFDHIRAERKLEIVKLIDYLNSKKYKQIISSFEEELSKLEETKENCSADYSTILEFASHSIYQKYTHIVEQGKRINKFSPDEEYHDLRIECKKLRYLCEFFISLYSRRVMDNFIGKLKNIQTILGDFQDCSVQQETLRYYLEDLLAKKDLKNEAAAIGGLLTAVYQKQQQFKVIFETAFAEFSKPANLRNAKKIFGIGK